MGAGAVRHAPKRAHSEAGSSVAIRASYVRIATPAHTYSDAELTAAFARLLEPRGTAALVARAWGTSAAFVFLVKRGDRNLTTDKIAALPPALLIRFRALLDAPTRREPIQLSFKGI